jgi:uncharacterized alkaline shock family protein YloU
MKLIYAFLSRLLMIVLLAASILGMLVTFPLSSPWFDPVRHFGHWLMQWVLPQPRLVFWFWFGLFWAIVALGALASALRKRSGGIAVQLDGGRVVILDSAIRKYLREALKAVREFELRRIEIYTLRNRLHVDIYAQVQAKAKLPELEAAVVEQVKKALREELGIEQDVFVQVYVTDFAGAGNGGDLVYRREWDENEEEPSAKTRHELDAGTEAEPEPLAFAWRKQEPDVAAAQAATTPTPAEEESGEQAAGGESEGESPRGGFWTRLRAKKSAATDNPADSQSTEAAGEEPQPEEKKQDEESEGGSKPDGGN